MCKVHDKKKKKKSQKAKTAKVYQLANLTQPNFKFDKGYKLYHSVQIILELT